MRDARAEGGSIIIMDPRTGEIPAQASYPPFNPNNSGAHTDAERNQLQSTYEPGSTFKIVTVSAALNEGLMTPAELVDTNPGSVKLAGQTHHWKCTERITVSSL